MCPPWINRQIISAAETGILAKLISTIEVNLPYMNLVNLSTSMHRLARLVGTDSSAQALLRNHPTLDGLLRAISAAFLNVGEDPSLPQTLSNIIWSLATVRCMDASLVEQAAALAVTNMPDFKPYELSSMLWACAKLGAGDVLARCMKPLFRIAASHVVENVRHIGYRSLATIAWAFATAKQHNARLFRGLSLEMRRMAQTANCQEIANTVWAFGTAGHRDERLFLALAEVALEHLGEFKPQELSNLLWGCATNDFYHAALFEGALRLVPQMDLQAQHLANILWACARLRPRLAITRAAALALLPRCTWQLQHFKPQEVSSTAMAVAKVFGPAQDDALPSRSSAPGHAGAGGPPSHSVEVPYQILSFFVAAGPWAQQHIRAFSGQSLANIVTAFDTLQLGRDGSLFLAVEREVLERVSALAPAVLVVLLKAFMSSPANGPRAVKALAGWLVRRFSALQPQDLKALMRVCSAHQRGPPRHDVTHDELYQWCVVLSAGPPAARGGADAAPCAPPHEEKPTQAAPTQETPWRVAPGGSAVAPGVYCASAEERREEALEASLDLAAEARGICVADVLPSSPGPERFSYIPTAESLPYITMPALPLAAAPHSLQEAGLGACSAPANSYATNESLPFTRLDPALYATNESLPFARLEPALYATNESLPFARLEPALYGSVESEASVDDVAYIATFDSLPEMNLHAGLFARSTPRASPYEAFSGMLHAAAADPRPCAGPDGAPQMPASVSLPGQWCWAAPAAQPVDLTSPGASPAAGAKLQAVHSVQLAEPCDDETSEEDSFDPPRLPTLLDMRKFKSEPPPARMLKDGSGGQSFKLRHIAGLSGAGYGKALDLPRLVQVLPPLAEQSKLEREQELGDSRWDRQRSDSCSGASATSSGEGAYDEAMTATLQLANRPAA